MKYRLFVMTCTQSFSVLRSQFRLLISSSKQETKRRFYFTANRKPKRRFYFTANRKPKRRFYFTANRKLKRRFYFTANRKLKRRFYFTAKESITLLMSISQCLQQCKTAILDSLSVSTVDRTSFLTLLVILISLKLLPAVDVVTGIGQF